jgi:hypothetical protein
MVGVLISATTDGGPQRHWPSTRGLGLRLKGDHLCPQRKSLQGPRLSTPVSARLREDECQHRQTSQKSHDRQKLKLENYILERTRAFFTGRFDMPCSGAERFEPCSGTVRLESTVSGASLLRSAASTAQHSPPFARGLSPRSPLWPGMGRGPHL